MIEKVDNSKQNIHHLFKYDEVREKIVEIFGEPETDLEHQFIQKETIWAWKRVPCYKISMKKHKAIHIHQGIKKKIRISNK